MKTLQKAPYEEFPVFVNFSADLGLGETISSYTISCINVSNNINTASSIIASSQISGAKVECYIKAGVLSETHKITIKAQTSAENHYEKEIFLFIAYDEDDSFDKQPRDRFYILNDFTEDIKSELIDSAEVLAERVVDEADFTSIVIDSTIISGRKLLAKVKAGYSGEFYRIVMQVVDTAGNKYQKNIIMGVFDA